MEEADIIILVVDGLTGVTLGDELVAKVLYRTDKPVMLAVNKADSKAAQDNLYDFYNLGLGDPYPVSAIHGTGTGDLLDILVDNFPAVDLLDQEEDERLKIAIVGRPNVGKSSILNRILGYERVIVSQVPGTTRDAIDTVITFDGEEIVLIDTADMRRRGRIEPGVEQYSVLRAFKAIKRADVCLLVVDATDLVASQDAHIGGYILEDYKGVVIVVNKWDLIEKDTHTIEGFTDLVRTELRFLSYAPIIFVSALTGQRIQNILQLAQQVQEFRMRRIPTAELNRFMQEAITKNPPKGSHRHALRFYYVTQASVAPPTFVFFVNNAKLVHFTYQRYLENQLRDTYQFIGTPVKLLFRNRSED
jgi:GTP-binding protein